MGSTFQMRSVSGRKIRVFRAESGIVHAYAANNSGEDFFIDLSGIGADEFIDGKRVIGGNARSTMGELGGTAHSMISVGDIQQRIALSIRTLKKYQSKQL